MSILPTVISLQNLFSRFSFFSIELRVFLLSAKVDSNGPNGKAATEDNRGEVEVILCFIHLISTQGTNSRHCLSKPYSHVCNNLMKIFNPVYSNQALFYLSRFIIKHQIFLAILIFLDVMFSVFGNYLLVGSLTLATVNDKI